VCHVDALSVVDGKIAFDPAECDQCDACLDACPINANPMVREYSVDEILDIAREHRAFLSGITVSGGEATMQLKFVLELFAAIKADADLKNLSCFVDSNGHLGIDAWRRLMPVTDGGMLDIKAFDPAMHRELTGQDNRRSLQSAEFLSAAGKLYELRFLLIPGITDSKAEIESLIRFVEKLGKSTRIKLNAFQLHGVRGTAASWEPMTEDSVDAIAGQLAAAGITNVVRPALYI
jgi:YjjW family glycine radical enzyme activase